MTVLQPLAASLRVIQNSYKMQMAENVTRNTFQFTLALQPVLFTLLSVGIYRFAGKPDLSLYGIIGSGLIGMWNANLWTSGFIVQGERWSGTLELLLATPSSLMVVLFGKSLSNASASLGAIFITFLTGALVFRVPLAIEDPLGFLVGLILTLLALTTLGLVLGTLFVLTRAAGNMAQMLNYPIFILSGLTFPITTLPLWTRPLSWALAPSWGSQALGQAAGLSDEALMPAFLWLIVLAVIYFLIGLVAYRRIERIARAKGGLQEF